MTSSPAAAPAVDPNQRLELEAAANARLERLNGAAELQAGILALILPRGSRRARHAWRAEVTAAADAEALRGDVNRLSGAARLPWFELLLTRMRNQPLAVRKELLAATRRVMQARGTVRPIDRLHWLAMRRRLGEAVADDGRNPASADLSRLPQVEVTAIATYSAFLSRMVPIDAVDSVDSEPADAPGLLWYEAVMKTWRRHSVIEPCVAPDNDGLVHALHELQAMAWMQRPILVRGWVTAAGELSPHGQLGHGAADALRLSCSLIDSPLPPELTQHYRLQGPEALR